MPLLDGDFVITRVFDAPRDLVWKAFTESARLARWWGPKGFTVFSCKLDLRPGGLFHYGMRAPDGGEMWGKFVYREIFATGRLVFVASFSDAQGGTTRHPGSASWPLEVLNTVTFSGQGNRTSLTLRGSPVNAADDERRIFGAGRDGMRREFTGTWDQLAAYLELARRSEPR